MDAVAEHAGGDGSFAVRFVSAVLAGSDYFRAVGASILSGRDFAAADDPSSPPVAIVNERFAEQRWVTFGVPACRVPARRAMRADPAVALRRE